MKTLQRAGIYVAKVEIESQHIPPLLREKEYQAWEGILWKMDRLSQSACLLSQRELPGAGLSAPVGVCTELIVPLEWAAELASILPTPHDTILLFFFLNWSRIALQICIIFCCTAKWISLYVYIQLHFHGFLSPFVSSNEHWGFLHPVE